MAQSLRFILYALLLITALALAFAWDKDWLRQQQEKVLAAVATEEQQESPNTYLEQINIRTYGKDGQLVTRTHATSSEHFEQRAVTVISQPVIYYLSSDNTQWQVYAKRALRQDKSEDLSLLGSVKAVRQRDGLSLTTEELHWHSASRTAVSESEIEINQAFNILSSQGFKANLEQQTYELPNRVQATYYP